MLRDRIKKIIKENYPSINTDDLTADTNLVGTGLLDSLGFLTLVISIQQEFNIEVPFEKYSPEEFTIFGKFISICASSFEE